jgi:hypothetical protein
MYFTRRIAWMTPSWITVPDPATYDDVYPEVPFVEFYWGRDVKKVVDLKKFDLNTRSGYVAAIRAVGKAVIAIRSNDIGGSKKSATEMGQFSYFNEKELSRIDRPNTGKIAYMLKYKATVLKR